MERIDVDALSAASFARIIAALPHETRAVVTAHEHGTPWATVLVTPMTETLRSVFPCYPGGGTSDTSRQGQSGVMLGTGDNAHALQVVIARARRMAVSS